ncbi:MAG: hypothetical protein K1X39_03660 [Thermoflexales bacterium]|nr:hypothetical protein [Thermoflexales bacterium]
MKALKQLFGSLFAPVPSGPDANALIYFVRGKRCGAVTRVRINRMNDLSRDEDGVSFIVRKGVIDDVCFGRVDLTLRFDSRHNEIGREIEGGEFVTKVDYEAWLASRAGSPS